MPNDWFDGIVENLINDEGPYNNDPKDKGGETAWGISKAFCLSVGLDINISQLTREGAKNIYHDFFWEEYKFESLPNIRIAEELFEICVMSGPRAMGLVLQRAIRAVGIEIEEDGIIGPETKHAMTCIDNAGDMKCLVACLRSEKAGYLRDLDNVGYERGWVSRAYRHTYNTYPG